MVKKRIKSALRRVISAFPGGKIALDYLRKYRLNRRILEVGHCAAVFEQHYKGNWWGDNESISGPGSTVQYTENIRKMIPRMVSDLGASVILDAPCGDYNWFDKIRWENEISYVGGDIVEALVQKNKLKYENKNTQFIHLDIINDELPGADLWLCRDCFFHLPNRDVLLAIDNFLKSNIRYLLTTTHSNCDSNDDISVGSYRLLNLELPPFSLGKPIQVIDDWIEGHPVRHLGLWEREDLVNHLAFNDVFQEAVKERR